MLPRLSTEETQVGGSLPDDLTTPVYVYDALLERIDDLPLLLALQQRVNVSQIIDQTVPRHWLHQGLSLGKLVMGWTTYILSEGDHRKMTVRGWVADHRRVLEDLLGEPIRDTDFTDDRLGQVLTHLSDDAAWEEIEARLWQTSVQVYRLSPERVRVDPTTVPGYHTVEEGGLMQFGHSPDHPGQPQLKVVAGSVDIGSNGHLVAVDLVSGEHADDPLYGPMLARLRTTLQEPGLLYLGDSKMSALATRADLVAHGDFYLVPLSEVGEVPELLASWVERIVAQDSTQSATLIFAERASEKAPARLLGAGYEMTRPQTYLPPAGPALDWEERLLVIRSPGEARKEQVALEKRLSQATQALGELTPAPGRGRRRVSDETTLIQEATAILTRFGVTDFLHYTFRREETQTTQYVGRGRGSASRPTKTVTQVRYTITGVFREESAIREATFRMGWRLYATNQLAERLPLDEALRMYRKAPRIERHFHLLKDTPVGIAPLYVRLDAQIKGLTRLLSLCVRLLTLLEIVARRNLTQQKETLEGLYEGNPRQSTDQPTAQRLLKAFGHIDRIFLPLEGRILCYLTPLSPLQRKILSILELDERIYLDLLQNSA